MEVERWHFLQKSHAHPNFLVVFAKYSSSAILAEHFLVVRTGSLIFRSIYMSFLCLCGKDFRMLEGALEVQVAPIPDHSDQYMITYRTSSYPITFDSAKSFTFTDLLRRLQRVLMGRPDPAVKYTQQLVG